MALKDLSVETALTEGAIEAIVTGYVRYVTSEKKLELTPEGAKLSGKAKVLIHLVALQGWPYVTYFTIR